VLAGYQYVHEVCADATFAAFLRAYLDEVTPTLREVPGVDLAEYKNQLVVRFANPGIGDRLERICAFSSDRMPKFVLPALADNLAAGRSVAAAALVVAAWAGYVGAVAEADNPATLVDSQRDRLVANAQSPDPLAFVDDRRFFGDLPTSELFRAAFLRARRALHDDGPREAAERVARR
jgi:mannitol 2-dehydrogenase